MAHKVSFKRSKKTTGEGSRSRTLPDFNSDIFRSQRHQQRYETLKNWSFIKERRVDLKEDEYPEFTTELTRRRWTRLAEPLKKFDPELVLEFYANAWPTREGQVDRRTFVKG